MGPAGGEKQNCGEHPWVQFSWVLKSRCPLEAWVLGSCRRRTGTTFWNHHPTQKLSMFSGEPGSVDGWI